MENKTKLTISGNPKTRSKVSKLPNQKDKNRFIDKRADRSTKK